MCVINVNIHIYICIISISPVGGSAYFSFRVLLGLGLAAGSSRESGRFQAFSEIDMLVALVAEWLRWSVLWAESLGDNWKRFRACFILFSWHDFTVLSTSSWNSGSLQHWQAVFHTEMQRIDYNVQTPLQLARVDERIDEEPRVRWKAFLGRLCLHFKAAVWLQVFVCIAVSIARGKDVTGGIMGAESLVILLSTIFA